MILTPDRIGDAIAQLEKSEQVDWQKLANLQALDLVRAGRRFVEEAIKSNEEWDDEIRKVLVGA